MYMKMSFKLQREVTTTELAPSKNVSNRNFLKEEKSIEIHNKL